MKSSLEPRVYAVRWEDSACVLLDQTRIPRETVEWRCSDYRQVVEAIQKLVVRGAPAIGVAGAYGVVLAMEEAVAHEDHGRQREFFDRAVGEIAQARPTAVNLQWAVDRVRSLLKGVTAYERGTVDTLLAEAKRIHEEDIAANRQMAEFGYPLLPQGQGILTYCNTGDLATGGIGTAFGVLHEGYRQGGITRVYACETRPVLQGARLTAWELQQNKIPFSLICDNMAAVVMREKKVGAVILGADRIAANGDVANKVGSYSLAVLAKHHQIPFFVVAPSSTFDLSLETGSQIPIEERQAEEIYQALGENRFPEPVPVYNPAFDVTPHELISAIVCERGVIESPDTGKVRRLLG